MFKPYTRYAAAKISHSDAGAVVDGDELHGLAVLLQMRAADDDEAADGDALIGVAVKFGNGAIGLPGHLRVQVQRMAADGVAEKFEFILELLQRKEKAARESPRVSRAAVHGCSAAYF